MNITLIYVGTSNVCPCAARQVLKSNTTYTAHFAFLCILNIFNTCLSPPRKILEQVLVANLFDDLFVSHADRCINKKKLRGLSPRANYTDRAAAAGRQS
jgi:hypothetical protein